MNLAQERPQKKAEGAKRPRLFFGYGQKSVFMERCVQGSFILLVCLIVCNRVVLLHHWLRELYATDFFHKPGMYRGGRAWAYAWDLFSSLIVSSTSQSTCCCGCGGVLWVRRDFVVVFVLFPANAHGLRLVSFLVKQSRRGNVHWQNAQQKKNTIIIVSSTE